MKTKIIFTLLIGFLLFISQQSFGQRNHRRDRVVVVKTNVHRPVRRHVKVVHYNRRNRVVVRPRRVRAVAVLPSGYTTVVYNNRNFYHHNGFYYNQVGGNYTIVTPPRGLRVKVLHPGYKTIVIAGAPHYYYKGVYYKSVDNEYETVDPEIGTIVPDLPDENSEEISIDGQNYYEIDDQLYKPIVTNEGAQYEYVGKLNDGEQ